MMGILAPPCGFCNGVVLTIKIVDWTLEKYGAPIYVRHENVHNGYGVERLADWSVLRIGASCRMESLAEVRHGAGTIFSVHGRAHGVEEAAVRVSACR